MSNRPSNLPYKPTGGEIVAKRREIKQDTGVEPTISKVINLLIQEYGVTP